MYTRLLRNRNFMALWIGQLISFIGDYFVILAVPIAVNRMTGSAMMVGFAYMAAALPALALGPVAGVFIDRWDRRKVMITADILRGLTVLVLLAVDSAEMVWLFYLINFLIACISQFFLPARTAVLPLIVNDKDDWLTANGMMQVIGTAGFLAGPALAGFTIGLWGEKVAFIANAVGYFTSAVAVFTMRVPHLQRSAAPSPDPFKEVLSELKAGMSFLFASRSLVGVTACLTIMQLGMGALMVLWIPFLNRLFGQGAAGIGLVDSAFGSGLLVSGLALGWLSKRAGKPAIISWGLVAMGLLTSVLGYVPAFWMVVAGNVIYGLFWTPVSSALMTIQQLSTPDEMRGRVASSTNAFINAGALISMSAAAFTADAIGLRNVFVIVGGLILLSGVLGFWLLRDPLE